MNSCKALIEENNSTRRQRRATSLRRPRVLARSAIRHVIRIKPSRTDPAVLVVLSKALLRERDHAVERARGARVPHGVDADVLVVAGVVAFVELVTAAEFGADRVPEKLHDLDALLVIDAMRAAHIAREVFVDRRILEVLGR